MEGALALYQVVVVALQQQRGPVPPPHNIESLWSLESLEIVRVFRYDVTSPQQNTVRALFIHFKRIAKEKQKSSGSPALVTSLYVMAK